MNTKLMGNSSTSSNDVSFILTASAQAAAKSPVYIIPGTGRIANKSLPANVVFTSSSFPTYADFLDFLENNPMGVKSLRLQSDNTKNFAGSLKRVILKPNGTNNIEEVVELSTFRDRAFNSDTQDVITIDAQDFFGGGIVTIPALSLLFDGILQNSYVKVTFGVTSVQYNAPLTEL